MSLVYVQSVHVCCQKQIKSVHAKLKIETKHVLLAYGRSLPQKC